MMSPISTLKPHERVSGLVSFCENSIQTSLIAGFTYVTEDDIIIIMIIIIYTLLIFSAPFRADENMLTLIK